MKYFRISNLYDGDVVTEVSEPYISDLKLLTICIAIGRTMHSTRYIVSESSCKTTYILITCQAHWHCILIYLAGLRAKADLVTMSATIAMLYTYHFAVRISLTCYYSFLIYCLFFWHTYLHDMLLTMLTLKWYKI